ncbi:MAG: two-component regulator propeller domain-containing protein, partial [Bacteroidota bacterium]
MSRALRWLISGTLLLIGSFSFGQANNLFFRHLNTNDGLSNNTVYSINDDTLGFIWIGTRSGLNRFDGYSFRIYDNRSGLKNTMINIIFRDSKGRIWVGTQGGGLSRYAYETDTFTSFSNSPADSSSISHDDVQAIDEDSQGRIWIGTHEGALNRLDETKNKFVRIRLQEGLSPDFHINRINTILFENDTLLWIGTLDGLYRYNPKRDKVFPVLMDGKPLNRRVLCICNEGPVRIWLGTNNGIVGYDKLSHTAQYITTANSALTNDLILVIKRLQDGRLMIGTDGGGLDIYNPLTREITAYMSNPNAPYSLSNNSVYEIFIDRYNGLWVGNYIGGINYYSEFDWKFLPVQHEVNDLESLSDNHVRSFYQDSEGDIWIGTLGGLNQYNPNSGKFKTYTFNRNVANTLSSNTVLSMNEDHQGALWIGTYGGGISIFDKKRGTFRKFSHPDDLSHSLDKADIYGIVETTNKKICAASLGGIYLFDMNTGRMKRFQTSNSRLSNNTVKVLYLDRQGNIWAGTNQGINKFNPETGEFKVYTHSNTDPNSLTNNRILSITESKDGKLWIGTEGGGVGIFDPASENFSCLTSAEGLPDNVVNSVLQDNLGVFWFGTNKGLVRYDHIQKKLQVYTAADGLQANAFNQNAALKARDGKLFFGGINGFNVFYPGNLVSNLYPPKVILTDLYISNKLVNPGDEPLATQLFLQKKLTLNYQTNFEIHFSALGFINKGLYKYSYSLKGLDTAWTEYRDIRTVNYTNLNPGIYTLMVRAINSDGVISENPATLTIHILSPWWKTWWAYIVYTLVILGLLFLFMKFNISWIHVKNQLLLERKEKEQQEELNQLKLGFFTNISHEFKTPLTLILGHLDNLKEFSTGKQAETLNHIEKNAKRLLILINQLLEFRKAEIGLMKLKAGKGNIVLLINGIKASFDELAMKKNIGFEFICPVAIPEIWFDSEKIEKIVFNLLSNAFKHVDS